MSGDEIIVGDQRLLMRAAHLDDVAQVAALWNDCSNAMIGLDETTPEKLAMQWETPGFDLRKSAMVILTTDGTAVGCVVVWDEESLPVNIWIEGRVHPDYEKQGLGTQLMLWAEARANHVLPRVPSDIQVAMVTGTESTYSPARKLLQDLGFKMVREFWTMVAHFESPPEPPQWPVGMSVRPMRKAELGDVVHAARDSFRDHYGYVEQPFQQEFEQWQHKISRYDQYDPSLWFLAVEGDQIAGVSLCRPKSDEDPDMGWVSVLGVRRPWRRRGVALALLQHAFAGFFDRGTLKVGLGVDAESLTGATGLYEKAGMKVLRKYDAFEKIIRPGRDVTLRETSG